MKTHKLTRLTRRYLLTQVKKLILSEPKRIRMEAILQNVKGQDAPSCRTIGCIAGWTSVVAAARNKTLTEAVSEVYAGWGFSSPISKAKKLLRLSVKEEKRLFYLEYWPLNLLNAYDDAQTPLARAHVTCKRIDLFLKSGGRK